jgi:hypothetical protein
MPRRCLDQAEFHTLIVLALAYATFWRAKYVTSLPTCLGDKFDGVLNSHAFDTEPQGRIMSRTATPEASVGATEIRNLQASWLAFLSKLPTHNCPVKHSSQLLVSDWEGKEEQITMIRSLSDVGSMLLHFRCAGLLQGEVGALVVKTKRGPSHSVESLSRQDSSSIFFHFFQRLVQIYAS